MFGVNSCRAREVSHHSAFMAFMADNYSHAFSLIHPVDEFPFKEMRT